MRKLISKFSLLASVTLLWSTQSFAQDNPAAVILSPSFSIRQTTGNTGGGQTNYLVNVKGGYRVAAGWYFGMLLSEQIANGTDATNSVAIGNSIGYYMGRISVIASYFLTATQDEKSALGILRRTEGSGFQLDVNVLFPITETITFGPTLTYKTITFLKQESATGTYLSDKHTESYIYPYITFAYAF